jgi:serine/threonine protein kinase
VTFSVGSTVGPYSLVDILGEGRLATVYQAYHARLERWVAVKVLRSEAAEDPGATQGFLDAARRAARLEHPNIVPVYDVAEHEGTLYLVMKYIAGESLRARVRRGNLNLEEVSRLAGAVGAALDYAHLQGQSHGALRPSNILLAQEGGLYLNDFGTGRLTAPTTPGALDYVSPEQIRHPGFESAISDQYALGVVLFECLTGVLPFGARGAQQHAVDPLRVATAPSTLNPALGKAVDEVLRKALAHDPSERYPDIAALVNSFQKGAAPPRPATAPIKPPLPDWLMEGTEPLPPTMALPARGPGAQTPSFADPTSAVPRTPPVRIMLTLPDGEMIQLDGQSSYLIGRSDPQRSFRPDVDLGEFGGLDMGVSRQHGRLHLDDGRLFYTDLKSANGSSVNGARLYTEIPMQLQDGDEIGLGKLNVRVYFAL